MKSIDSLSDLRVGAYVDGLNVYHGGRHLCGRHAPGWRWFDLAASIERMIARNAAWAEKGAMLHPRTRVPTGTVNPRGRPTARDLRGEPHEGVGGHWWYRLTAEDFFDHQLPEVVGAARKPAAW